jgi:hypothetical protein
MRLSRDQVFDLIELVGKAVATARQRPVTQDWLDEISPKWLRDIPKPKPNPKAHTPGQDEFGLFDGSPWSSEEADSERTDLSTVVPGAADYNMGFSEVEKKTARRNQREFGDDISCRLWEIQRRMRFKLSTVTETLDQLRELCDWLGRKGYISKGWARSVRAVIDRCCL